VQILHRLVVELQQRFAAGADHELGLGTMFKTAAMNAGSPSITSV
jgi:hypothetical protein